VNVKRGFSAALASLLLACCIFATTDSARASPSGELGSVLSTVRGLFNTDFDQLVRWAKGNQESPGNDPAFQPQKVELAILNLGRDDRVAVLAWLTGHGRSGLYVQGASDADIGPRRDGLDQATATPKPVLWRNVPLASATLDNTPTGQIQIIGGFAAVKKDGTAAYICISFKNVDTRGAKRVVVEFPLLDRDGQVLGKLQLDRNGEFSPNVDINGYGSMDSWLGPSPGPRTQGDNCVAQNMPTAAIPFLQARTAGYHVTRVEYADGTSWSAPVPVPVATTP
jgi:hypothetical protein